MFGRPRSKSVLQLLDDVGEFRAVVAHVNLVGRVPEHALVVDDERPPTGERRSIQPIPR